MTQNITMKIFIKGKPQPPKESITMYYSAKIPFQYNHRIRQIHRHNQEMHVKKNESTHRMPCFQPSQMLPWLTCQALSHSTLVFSSSSCHFSHYNNYPCGCLYSTKSHKTTKWYYINHVLPNPLTPHLVLEI